MNLDRANETDIREDIAMPFLVALGYERGTANDIIRELSLAYDCMFLGRKKKSDPPIRGRADYVLSVAGAGRWVLEVKAPSEDLDKQAVEQAMSYARHPEVSGTYIVLLNGKRLVGYHYSQNSDDQPLVDLAIDSPETLAEETRGLLSPPSIRRDCSPPKVDLRLPLAPGLRSTAAVIGGEIGHRDFGWTSNEQLQPLQTAQLDDLCQRMIGFRTDVTGGRVWRDDSSRIKAKLVWAIPHDELLQFTLDKRLLDAEYIALSKEISSDPMKPTTFDVVGDVEIDEGETLFDILKWDTVVAGIAMSMSYQGQATGCIVEGVFRGDFQAEYQCTFPTALALQISMYTSGQFQVVLDDR